MREVFSRDFVFLGQNKEPEFNLYGSIPVFCVPVFCQKVVGQAGDKTPNNSTSDICKYDFCGHILSGFSGALTVLIVNYFISRKRKVELS
jgi:hypothetical protein